MKNILLITTAISFFFASCSSPSSIAKKMVEDEITKKSQGYLKLVNYEIKDARSSKNGGVENYYAQYEGEVECIKDGGWVWILKADSSIIISPDCFADRRSAINSLSGFGGIPTQTKTGTKYKCSSGLIYIEKHDQGWVIMNSHF